jgi:predicted 2-oxoglutarate/Fe(II)-dependent dioxygenase YbiX|tara:strand:- start:414 stop:986 length:573 start_codon:yes stop_codon:yes gene_type:complete
MSNRPPYWYWHNMLNLKQVKQINKHIDKNYKEDENENLGARGPHGEKLKNLTTKIINYKKVKKYINHIVENVFLINRDHFGYDLFNISDQMGTHYNVYDSKLGAQAYDWHIDRSLFPNSDMKLTVVINLSEKSFEGGDLFIQQTEVMGIPELKQIGTVIAFPPSVRHKVTPITKGVRKNLVLFFMGPNFK